MRHISIFRLPIFWLFLGPPAFRAGGARSAMESVEGGQDIWNYIRLAWWLVFGIVAVIEIAKDRQSIQYLFNYIRGLHLWIGAMLLAVFASAAVSPSPTFTFANAALLTILALAGLDLALKLFRGAISPQRTLKLLLGASVLMLLVTTVVHLVSPDMVGGESFSGRRIRGNSVAYTPLLGQIVVLVALYFRFAGGLRRNWLPWALLVFGIVWLYYGQTRSSYLGLGLALGLMLWQWTDLKRNLVLLIALAAIGISGICGIVMLSDASHTIRWEMDQAYKRFVLRDKYAVQDREFAEKNIGSLNGRTDVAALLIDASATKPLGMGFIAGPRVYLQSDEVVGELNSQAFGNAHNAFIEMWSGAGYVAFFGSLAMVWLGFGLGRWVPGREA
ncbi:MAG: O-antigen ligase family protein, partial [Bacteroidota bacterium]